MRRFSVQSRLFSKCFLLWQDHVLRVGWLLALLVGLEWEMVALFAGNFSQGY